MRKLYIYISCVFVIFVLETCHSSKGALVQTKPIEAADTNQSALQYKIVETITYLPTRDSINEISINLVGDLMCHLPQTNNAKLANGKFDFNPSFEYVKMYLQNADYTIGNLETTFAGTVQPYAGYPAFNSPDEYCEALKNTGFDFLVTANNHSMDTREQGLLRTIDVIKKNNLGYAGTYLNQKDHDSIRIISIKGIKLAILNYTYGTNGSYPSNQHSYMLNLIDSVGVTNSVKSAKKLGADIVLVFYHMGVENVSEPTKAQKDAVKYALQAGAELVIGAHPHVVGPTKIEKSALSNDTVFIAYSLGNFLSNQYWRYTDAGVILSLKIQKNYTKNITKFIEAGYMPTWVYRGDGTRKMHVILPAQLALDSTKLPDFITKNHQKKMIEAFEDTKAVITKNNPSINLIQSK